MQLADLIKAADTDETLYGDCKVGGAKGRKGLEGEGPMNVVVF